MSDNRYYVNFCGINILDTPQDGCKDKNHELFALGCYLDALAFRGSRYVAVVGLYGDESVTKNFFGVGVLIATEERWRRFRDLWQGALEDAGMRDEAGALLPFHMADFESPHPPFSGWDERKRVAVISRLIEIINDTFEIGFASRVSLGLYRQFIGINPGLPNDHKLHRCILYSLCLVRLVPLLTSALRGQPHIQRVMQVFDRNAHVSAMIQGHHEYVASKDSEYDALFSAPVFEDKRRVIQLQAADIAIYEVVKFAERRLAKGPMRKSYKALDRSRLLVADCDEKFLDTHAQQLYDLLVEDGIIQPINPDIIESHRNGVWIITNWADGVTTTSVGDRTILGERFKLGQKNPISNARPR